HASVTSRPHFPYTTLFRSLPLADLSRDTLHSWFADGITEALVTDLGRIRALRVTSRSAVLQFKDTASFRDMVRELHVDAVVEGGDRKSTRLNSSHRTTSYA